MPEESDGLHETTASPSNGTVGNTSRCQIPFGNCACCSRRERRVGAKRPSHPMKRLGSMATEMTQKAPTTRFANAPSSLVRLRWSWLLL